MPIAFDDPSVPEAMARYATGVRPEAAGRDRWAQAEVAR